MQKGQAVGSSGTAAAQQAQDAEFNPSTVKEKQTDRKQN
jgi:hypothetical protein